ncbi:hypothetical protein KM043_008905 [Ampulex compressa]|nr:hypothetical protein KM043_008905 [Ampulex compressa]
MPNTATVWDALATSVESVKRSSDRIESLALRRFETVVERWRVWRGAEKSARRPNLESGKSIRFKVLGSAGNKGAARDPSRGSEAAYEMRASFARANERAAHPVCARMASDEPAGRRAVAPAIDGVRPNFVSGANRVPKLFSITRCYARTSISSRTLRHVEVADRIAAGAPSAGSGNGTCPKRNDVSASFCSFERKFREVCTKLEFASLFSAIRAQGVYDDRDAKAVPPSSIVHASAYESVDAPRGVRPASVGRGFSRRDKSVGDIYDIGVEGRSGWEGRERRRSRARGALARPAAGSRLPEFFPPAENNACAHATLARLSPLRRLRFAHRAFAASVHGHGARETSSRLDGSSTLRLFGPPSGGASFFQGRYADPRSGHPPATRLWTDLPASLLSVEARGERRERVLGAATDS